MTPLRPLPPIAPCPGVACDAHEREICSEVVVNPVSGKFSVRCACGWSGPERTSERAAILSWNRRSDAEAERRLRKLAELWARVESTPILKDGSSASWTHELLAFEREIKKLRGEVLPAAKKKKHLS